MLFGTEKRGISVLKQPVATTLQPLLSPFLPPLVLLASIHYWRFYVSNQNAVGHLEDLLYKFFGEESEGIHPNNFQKRSVGILP
jgi:hypothetical protein